MPFRIDPNSWADLSRLLDPALDLPLVERGPWLDALDCGDPQLKFACARSCPTPPASRRRPSRPAPELHASETELAALDRTPERAGHRIGPYRLVRELGVGGMGSVWLAERLDGLVPRRSRSSFRTCLARHGFAERIARERSILATLAHPGIARLYDAGVTAAGRLIWRSSMWTARASMSTAIAFGSSLTARLRLFLQSPGPWPTRMPSWSCIAT